MLSMWLIHLTFVYLLEVEGRVRRGEYAQLLVRPGHPIVLDLAANLAYKALTAPILAAATLLLLPGLGPRLAPPQWAVVAFLPAVLLAFALRFLNGWTFSLVAFWTTRTQAFVNLYLLVLFYLTGEHAPMAARPGWVQMLGWWSPFRWMMAFPVELLLGRLAPDEALVGFGMQAGWTLASLPLLALTWRAAVRRYSAAGG
jgi:ABC-2 type transport system permease protein